MASIPKETLNTLRVGGVPEHFNHLWTIAQEQKLFEKHGVRVAWTVQRCGTGEMISSIHRNDLDVIVALTEGVVTDSAKNPTGRSNGGRLKILGTYVQSPLCWAINCGPHRDPSTLNGSLDDLKGKTWAISRFGSGSHLMAYVLAQSRGWDTRSGADLKFKVAGDIHGLIKSVSIPEDADEADPASESDLFMWETFTTKPWHDKGVLQRVGEFYTPWPCFVLAATSRTAATRTRDLHAMFAGLAEAAAIFNGNTEAMPKEIAARYKLKPDDAKAWYSTVRISPTPHIESSVVRQVYRSIFGVGLLGDSAVDPSVVNLHDLVASDVCQLKNTSAKPGL